MTLVQLTRLDPSLQGCRRKVLGNGEPGIDTAKIVSGGQTSGYRAWRIEAARVGSMLSEPAAESKSSSCPDSFMPSTYLRTKNAAVSNELRRRDPGETHRTCTSSHLSLPFVGSRRHRSVGLLTARAVVLALGQGGEKETYGCCTMRLPCGCLDNVSALWSPAPWAKPIPLSLRSFGDSPSSLITAVSLRAYHVKIELGQQTLHTHERYSL